jgi:hypothetical protein
MLQCVTPFVSSEDAAKGGRWATTIGNELEATRVGIVCLTRDNVSSRWIHFEAGALSKAVESAKLCPLLFDIEQSDITGPLAQFQCAKFSRDEMLRVVRMMNDEAGEQKLTDGVLSDTFDKWWPDLKEKISAALAASPPREAAPRRDPREVQDEILSLVREMARERDPKLLSLIEGLQHVVRLLLDIVERLRATNPPSADPVTLGEFATAMHGGPRSWVTDPTPGTLPSTGPGWIPTKT